MLKLYNTLTKKKEIFKPIKNNKVGIYTCGPTVYWFAHAGNMRAYIFADTLKRILMYNGFEVNHIINITDVGHLTSDADFGEDKLEKSAKKEGKTATEISHFYAEAFKKDFKKLNLIEPSKWAWATKHIKEQIEMIDVLEKKGFTYKTSDGIYFDTSKFKDYGKLSNKKSDGLEAGKRVSIGEKKHKTDFALWKFSKKQGERQQEWDSPWGIGFPGWHIECSAMAIKYLGEHFDIHTGGEDHIPIHHENEIAQSECFTGENMWVNYWMHVAFLNIRGGKMSKSSGNVKTISELENNGIPPLAYRYFTYTAKYRKPLTWSEDGLNGAVNSYNRLREIISKINKTNGINKKYLEEFEERVYDDLDMPNAIAVLWKLVRDKNADGKLETIRKMDRVLGLKLIDTKKIKIPENIKIIAEERKAARLEGNWDKSDELRTKLKKLGWIIKDEKDGYELEERQNFI